MNVSHRSETQRIVKTAQNAQHPRFFFATRDIAMSRSAQKERRRTLNLWKEKTVYVEGK
jgi:hypothetical protein